MHYAACVLTKAAKVPIQPDVAESCLGGLNLSLVLLAPVTLVMDAAMTIFCVVIKGDLCIHADD